MPIMLPESKGHPTTILCRHSGEAEVRSSPMATPTLEEDGWPVPSSSKPLYRQCYPKVTHAVRIKLEVITTLIVTVSYSIFSLAQKPLTSRT